MNEQPINSSETPYIGHPENPQKGFDDSISDELFIPEPDIIPIENKLLVVAEFSITLLPESLREWVQDSHERIGCPIDYLAIGAMVSLATVIGRKVGIYPKAYDDWQVIPNLWGCMIGRPSAMKSPAMGEAIKPLERLVMRAKECYKDALREAKAQEIINNELIEQAKKSLKDATAKGSNKAGQSIEECARNYQELTENIEGKPTEKRYIVNDSTIEKLGELLNENPNGLLMLRDELTGWIKTIDREDRASDRAFYLEAFNGSGGFTVDRIGRGTFYIESLTVSILGGIQPSKLAPYVQGAISMSGNDDGFMQRLQLAVYPDIPSIRGIDRYPNKEARNKAFQVFETLDDMPSKRYIDDFDIERITCLRFTSEAQALFNQWMEQMDNYIRHEQMHPALESHLIKYKSLIPSIALIHELADNPEAETVSKESLLCAIAWGNYLRLHAMRIYDFSMKSGDTESAQLLIDRRDKLPPNFKIKDIKDKGWTGLSETAYIKKVLSMLVDHGYLIEQLEQTSGRPNISYRWNKNLKNG